MKAFTINIHTELKNVEITVKNGRLFSENAISGNYKKFNFTVSENDAKRIKEFAVKHGNDNSSNKGNWYAHCNGYAMDLMVTQSGKSFSLNTYRPYGKCEPSK